MFNNFDTTKGAGYEYSYYTYYYEYRETEGKDKGNGARLRQSADRRRAGKAIGFEHDETPAAGLPAQALTSEGPLPSGSPGGHANGGSATNGGAPTNGGSPTADDLASSVWLEGLTAPRRPRRAPRHRPPRRRRRRPRHRFPRASPRPWRPLPRPRRRAPSPSAPSPTEVLRNHFRPLLHQTMRTGERLALGTPQSS